MRSRPAGAAAVLGRPATPGTIGLHRLAAPLTGPWLGGARPSLRTIAGRPEQLLRRAADRPAGTDHPTGQLRTRGEQAGPRYRWHGLSQQRTHFRDIAVTHPRAIGSWRCRPLRGDLRRRGAGKERVTRSKRSWSRCPVGGFGDAGSLVMVLRDVLTDTQFAHDGVSHHADVAFHGVRVLASGSAPWRRAARAVLRRGDRLQRRAAAPLPLLDASRLRCGSACPRTDPSARTSTALGVPANVCTRMSSRLQKLSTVPLYELDAVMCTTPAGNTGLVAQRHDAVAVRQEPTTAARHSDPLRCARRVFLSDVSLRSSPLPPCHRAHRG